MSLVIDYIQYLLNAKTRHGIHSPFVYEFVDQYLQQKIDSNITQAIEQVRKQLLNDSNTIVFEDLGAGSKNVKSNQPSIKSLAKNSLKPKKYAKLIGQFAKYINAKTIIELGTSLGTTTLYISLLNPSASIITLEGSPAVAKIAQEQFNKLNAKNIQIKIGNFNDTFPKLLEEKPHPDLIFIDGNHTYEATMRYFKLALNNCPKNSFLIFDDINWSGGMKKAWDEIKRHPKVSISMDFFFLGIVSFNPDFSKEDFVIRY